MQADNRAEKAELRRVMWSPYPDNHLTLWAAPPAPQPPSQPSHLDSPAEQRAKKQQRLQRWRISRDFQPNLSPKAKKPHGNSSGGSSRSNTTEVLATHRLSFANQSIVQLSIIVPQPSAEHFSKLVELRMPQNKLRRLPRALFMLEQLEILNLENNRLDEHSADDLWWPRLAHLRVLFLAANRFTRLPQTLGKMARLFYLDVSDCTWLTCLPAELLASDSMGTLATNRCSLELADRFITRRDGPSPPAIVAVVGEERGVPRLVDLCVQSVYLATMLPRQGSERMRAVCGEMRRNPDDFFVSGLLLRRLDGAERLKTCSVCRRPVFCPGRAVLRTVEHWALPFVWQCCSQRCCDEAKTLAITSSSLLNKQ
ncbi:hypothetical protein LPJ53_002727 [Coemansia erecta]|uniref:L domain-like protein n=1 Tax=Coemansia erecta TaxID=147472 RepID=A0A9W7Y2X9_9FUNG|nr:hypothetical protein LPJ53_002727 [Coemansia erecta]